MSLFKRLAKFYFTIGFLRILKNDNKIFKIFVVFKSAKKVGPPVNSYFKQILNNYNGNLMFINNFQNMDMLIFFGFFAFLCLKVKTKTNFRQKIRDNRSIGRWRASFTGFGWCNFIRGKEEKKTKVKLFI